MTETSHSLPFIRESVPSDTTLWEYLNEADAMALREKIPLDITLGRDRRQTALDDAIQNVEKASEMLREVSEDPEEFRRRFTRLQQAEEDLDTAAIAYLEAAQRAPLRLLA